MSDYELVAGATSQRIGVWLADSSSTTGEGLAGLVFNSAGLTCYYWREDEGNAGATAVTLATATRGTFTSSGFIEKDATNMPGAYEFGIPNAAIGTGAKWVKVMFKGATDLAPRVFTIRLVLIPLDIAGGAAGGVFIAGTNAATVVTTSLTTTFTGNLTGSVASVSGAVGSVTGNVGGNVAGSVGSVTGAVGSVTGAVGSVAAGGIAAASFAAGAIDATAIANAAIDAATFAAGAITATVIADGAIDAATFAAGAIDATAIANGAIDAATFAANAITSTVVADDFITAAKIDTGAIVAATFAAGAIDAAAISADAGAELADAFLNRNMATGTDSGTETVRTPRQALRMLRNKVSTVSGEVMKEDDSTVSWNFSLTTDAAADPITIIDPDS